MEVQTVSQLTRKIRELLEFQIGSVWVEGEVSNHRLQASGHQYFTLKDQHAQLNCVFFRGHARFNRTPIQDGAKMRVFGDLGLYEVRGQYQLVVRQVRALGAGNLHEQFEALKQRLQEKGLFDQARKQPIPRFPKRLGLVTSPTGAVVQDMLSVLKRRAPWVEVLLYPARVQGDGAFLEIMDGIDYFANVPDPKHQVDTIIIARGGGSLEDLWSFNEEALAHVIDECEVPIVSAVGHETDFAISDFVADQRAPTPSAAAELTTPDGAELRAWFEQRQRQLARAAERNLSQWQDRLAWCERRGGFLTPQRVLNRLEQQLDDRFEQLVDQLASAFEQRKQRIEQQAQALRVLAPSAQLERVRERLEERLRRLRVAIDGQFAERLRNLQHCQDQLRALGPEQTLSRGYSLLLDEEGKVVSSAEELKPKQPVTIRLHDGKRGATIDS